MALTFADRVRETTTTAGTGTLDLAGAVDTYQGFVAGAGDAAEVVYVIVHRTANEWEVGEGTVTDASPDTLSRDTIRDGSNGSSAVNFSAGTKDVYLTMGASDIEPDLQSDVDETVTGEWTMGDLTISNPDDAATVTPLTVRGNRANPADGDVLQVDYTLHDEGGNDTIMARWEVEAADVTASSEDGYLRIYTRDGNNFREAIRFTSGETTVNGDNEARDFIVRQGDATDALTITAGGGFGSHVGIYNESPSFPLDLSGEFHGDSAFVLDEISTPSNPSAGANKLYFKSDGNLYKLDSSGTEAQVGGGGGGGGSAVTLDLGDDGANESTDLSEIATSGDTNSIFTEPSADKLLIDLSANWPTADDADALDGNASSFYRDASNLNAGTLADARVAASNVTQHEGSIDHDALTNFVADEHVAHSSITLTAGDGLSGGGDISANRTFAVDVSDFAGTGLEDDGSENLRIAAAAAGNGLTGGGGSALAIDTDGVATDELDLSITPTWTGLHTFGAGLALLDDDQLQLGTGTDYWLEYDATGTQLRLRTTDADGGGTDGTVMSVADGTDDVVFEGAVTSKAAGDSFVLPVGTDKFAS